MDINNLKCVVGKAESNKPAVIRLFGSIDEENCRNFNSELLWLDEEVKPSKILVLINSEGGSCLHGMSVYSTIQSCSAKVECINEGLAASMASVIWTAGTQSYMRDYSILMIHNPFSGNGEADNAIVSAFKQQLATIYSKRFGLPKDKVDAIMNGPEGQDGTYFSAKEAVCAGILSSENVLSTCKQTRCKVKNQIESVSNSVDIRKIMEKVYAEVDENKLPDLLFSIHNQNEVLNVTNTNTNMNEENLNFSVVAAQLGLEAKAPSATVSARITELLGVEAKLKNTESKLAEVEGKLSNLSIESEGYKTQAQNLQTSLDETKAALSVYQDAEKAAKQAEIANMVEGAITAGKIAEEAKEQWIEMAQANLDMVKKTLDSIPGREVISNEIANDKENKKNATEASVTEADKLKAKVDEVISKDFKFGKLD